MALIQESQIAVMNQHYQRFSFEYFLDCQQRLGVRHIELWCGAPHVILDGLRPTDAKTIRHEMHSRGLKAVSLVCPSFAYHHHYAQCNAEHWTETMDYFKNGIRLASELGCGIVGVNSGYGLLDEKPGEAFKRSVDMLASLSHFAASQGVMLALESLREDESDIVHTLSGAEKMWREINHPAFCVMVDTIATGAAGETLQQWFDTFGSALVHMHFLDGDPYVHSIWGDGNYPLAGMLSCLKSNGYGGYLVQEVADEAYLTNPMEADRRNLFVLRQHT